ncbi:MAG TPA: HAMP domain-containing protein, partial [Pseudoxanthomonas sp.]
MKALRFGLQARFLAAMAIMLLVVIALVATLLHRQKVMQKEVAELGRDAMHGMVEDSLRRHGEATVDQLADALANPLYYFDLDAVGSLVRSAQKEPDVSYVLVYDNQGRIIHDGTADIAVYGQTMTDPLAYEAINSQAMHTQWSTQIVDVSEPIMIGSERIGGVRVGYSVASVRAYEDKAINAARARLNELGARHLGWIALLLAALAGVSVAIMVYVQRTLVRPIRQLARAAHDIEVGNYNGERMASARQDEVGELVRAFGTMSDSIARHDRDVRRMAYTDSLTGLTNRLAFRESLDHRLMMLRGAGRQ